MGLLIVQHVVVDVVSTRLLNPGTNQCRGGEIKGRALHCCHGTHWDKVFVQGMVGVTVHSELMVENRTLRNKMI